MLATKPPSPKQIQNYRALKIYAAAACAIVVVVVALQWFRHVCHRFRRHAPPGQAGDATARSILRAFYKFEKTPRWKLLCQLSYGIVAVLGILLIINIFLSFNIIAGHELKLFASRFGWLAAANMILCVVFALKTSPLEYLAAVSHTRLIALHRIMGYAIALLVVVHAILYTAFFIQQGRMFKLLHASNIAGMAAAVAMAVLVVGGYLRHRHYEAFYASHVFAFAATVPLTALHRPAWFQKLPYAMTFLAIIWVLDRLVRMARMCWNLVNNEVAVYPLADAGGIRVVLRKPGAAAAPPGSYCYLWIPGVSFFQTHPFTIVNNGPAGLELVIQTQQGFTKALYDRAARRPGFTSRASIDGPYGTLPDVVHYDKVVLVAGGSGAAFTFGVANRILGHRGADHTLLPSVDFVWSIRRADQFLWFKENMRALTDAGIAANVSVYITQEQKPSGLVLYKDNDGADAEPDLADLSLAESDVCEVDELEGLLSEYPTTRAVENECSFRYSRMCVDAVIADAMHSVKRHAPVLVAVCGPDSLLDDVRSAAESYRSKHDCQMDIHCETFDS